MPGNKSSQLKGAIFEWFVRSILASCGFTLVKPDAVFPKLVFRSGGNKLMVHGLGHAHDIDVLMYPPLQIPLYSPSRLAVECKAYTQEPVRLPVLRGLLGLRQDINNFDIITPTILENRQKPRRKKTGNYFYERFQYQVSLATLDKVTIPAQEFAITHKIPIVSFHDSKRYLFLREFISNINQTFCDSLGGSFNKILSYFKGVGLSEQFDAGINPTLSAFMKEANELFDKMYVGVTENSSILFLYSEQPKQRMLDLEFDSTIHWDRSYSEWTIEVEEADKRSLSFEVPSHIYNQWADSEFNKHKAISLKQKYFKRILIFGSKENQLIFFVLNLDQEFIRRAKRNLVETNNEQ